MLEYRLFHKFVVRFRLRQTTYLAVSQVLFKHLAQELISVLLEILENRLFFVELGGLLRVLLSAKSDLSQWFGPFLDSDVVKENI